MRKLLFGVLVLMLTACGGKANNVKENETRLFDEVIQVEVNRKNAPNLTLYDMPGINFKEDIQKKINIK